MLPKAVCQRVIESQDASTRSSRLRRAQFSNGCFERAGRLARARQSTHGAGTDARWQDPPRCTGGGDRMHEAPVAWTHRSRSPTQFRQMAAAIIWTAQFVNRSRPQQVRSSGASMCAACREDPLRSRDEPLFNRLAAESIRVPFVCVTRGIGTANGRWLPGLPWVRAGLHFTFPVGPRSARPLRIDR
jgi:hypothetical protein